MYGYRSSNIEIIFVSYFLFQMNWVCDGAFQLAFGQSLFYVGSVIGTILFGTLADKIGRLPAMIMSLLSGGIGDFATALTGSLPTFALGRFVSGLATDTSFYLMYIMGKCLGLLIFFLYILSMFIVWNWFV